MDENEQPTFDDVAGKVPKTPAPDEREPTSRLSALAEPPPTGEVRIAAVQAAVAAGLAESTPPSAPAPPAPPVATPPPPAPQNVTTPPARPVATPPPAGPPPTAADAPVADEFAPFAPEAIAPPQAPEPPDTLGMVVDGEVLAAFGIPDWTEPPTGQVPRILLDDPNAAIEPDLVPGPTWREESSDWDDVAEHLAYLVEETQENVAIAGREPDNATGEHDVLGLQELDAALIDALEPAEHAAAWDEVLQVPVEEEVPEVPENPVERRRKLRIARARRADAARVAEATARPPARRSPIIATMTGIVFGVVVVVCVLGGAASSLGLAVAVLLLATAELFGALRRGGYAPATIVGLLAVPALVVVSYCHGLPGLVATMVIALALLVAWSFAGLGRQEPVTNLGVSVLAICWVGLLGAFAGLLLSPTTYPHRYGIDLFFAAIAITVGHDVGSYAVGSRLGRHRFAPRLSPGKSVEGLIGGTIVAVAVALGIVWRIAPFTLGEVLGLAAIVSVFAPAGDLFESLVKRDLQLKDMGSLLPGHGGIFDRIDALLFVLPATYYFVHVVHFG